MIASSARPDWDAIFVTVHRALEQEPHLLIEQQAMLDALNTLSLAHTVPGYDLGGGLPSRAERRIGEIIGQWRIVHVPR